MHVLLFWMISHCFLLIVHFLFSLCECAADAHDLLLIEAFETICLVHHTNLIFEDLRTIKKLERPCKWCKKRRIIVRKERTFWCFEFASYWNCATLLLLFFFFFFKFFTHYIHLYVKMQETNLNGQGTLEFYKWKCTKPSTNFKWRKLI